MKNGPYTLVIAPPEYPGKRYRGKYCYEHHLVWWENTGETVKDGELIHHKNRVKTDNAFSNLEKETKASHAKEHSADAELPVRLTCFQCGGLFDMSFRDYKSREKTNGHTDFCCSRSCQVKKQRSELKAKKLASLVRAQPCQPSSA